MAQWLLSIGGSSTTVNLPDDFFDGDTGNFSTAIDLPALSTPGSSPISAQVVFAYADGELNVRLQGETQIALASVEFSATATGDATGAEGPLQVNVEIQGQRYRIDETITVEPVPVPDDPTVIDFAVTGQSAGGTGVHTLGIACELTGSSSVATLVAGEPYTLNASIVGIEPAPPITSTRWTITGPVPPVADYVVSTNAAVVTPLVLNATPVQLRPSLHFIAPGEYVVTLVVSVIFGLPCENPGPQTATHVKTVTVVAPTITVQRSETSGVFVGAIPPGPDEPNMPYIGMGNAEEDGALPGYRSYTQATRVAPVPAGTLRIVQLTNYDVRFSGDAEVHSTGGAEMLDGRLPYTADVDFSGVNSRIYGPDSPAQIVTPDYSSISVNERFRQFVQWKSQAPSSIWVTLGLYTWFWTAQGTVTDGVMTLTAADYTNRLLPDKTDRTAVTSSVLPTWTALAKRDQIVERPAGTRVNAAVAPSLSSPDTPGSSQYGAQQLVISIEPTPTGKFTEYTPAQVADVIARPVSQLTYGGGTHFVTWARPTDLPRQYITLSVVSSPYPIEPRLEKIDLSASTTPPKAGGTQTYVFRIQVAPFCLGNNPSFWTSSIAAPGEDDDPDAIDLTLTGYMKRLGALLGANVNVEAADASTVQVTFYSQPTTDTMRQIAELSQTTLVNHVAAGQFIIPPSSPPPNPPHTTSADSRPNAPSNLTVTT